MKESKPITALDIFNAIIFVAVGTAIAFVISNSPLNNMPYAGAMILGGMILALVGIIRFIVKFFKQPVNQEKKQ